MGQLVNRGYSQLLPGDLLESLHPDKGCECEMCLLMRLILRLLDTKISLTADVRLPACLAGDGIAHLASLPVAPAVELQAVLAWVSHLSSCVSPTQHCPRVCWAGASPSSDNRLVVVVCLGHRHPDTGQTDGALLLPYSKTLSPSLTKLQSPPVCAPPASRSGTSGAPFLGTCPRVLVAYPGIF